MQWLVVKLGWLLQVRISLVESMMYKSFLCLSMMDSTQMSMMEKHLSRVHDDKTSTAEPNYIGYNGHNGSGVDERISKHLSRAE